MTKADANTITLSLMLLQTDVAYATNFMPATNVMMN